MSSDDLSDSASDCKLSKNDITRYARQLVLRGFELRGQVNLLNASVLVVGCGGLGSFVSMELAAAGVGTLGLVDGDIVDVSNLHRQLIHHETDAGKMNKAESAGKHLKEMTTRISVQVFPAHLTAAKFAEDHESFEMICDCTDNFDAVRQCNLLAVLWKVPLVSASVVRMEGHLANYNYPVGVGPCYECAHPQHATDERSLARAADVGVLGPVVATIGSLQALEAIKILVGSPIHGHGALANGEMVIVDCASLNNRRIRLRGKRQNCWVCGNKKDDVNDHQLDHSLVASSGNPEGKCPMISARELNALLEEKRCHIVDIRPRHEFALASLPSSTNIPVCQCELSAWRLPAKLSISKSLLVLICRRGFESRRLSAYLANDEGQCLVKYLDGGLASWKQTVDLTFPLY